MTHVDDQFVYTPPKPETFARVCDKAIGEIKLEDHPYPPVPSNLVTYKFLPEEVDGDLPEEYQGAEVLPALMDHIKSKPISVLLYGPPGSGKTRQGYALLRQERLLRAASLILDGEEVHSRTWRDDHGTEQRGFTRSEWAEWKLHTLACGDRVFIITESADIRRFRYDRVKLDEWCEFPRTLVVDDIGFMEPNDWVKESIYHLANERRANGRRTIWTSNLDPNGLREAFGPAIASRLTGGVILNLDGEDRRNV